MAAVPRSRHADAKTYDAAYFHRWYRGPQAHGKAALKRKVAFAVALAELYWQRPIRSVLDVGCGEAAWRAPLLALRPGLRYQGVDSSEYAVARYGRARNIALADFGQLGELRLGPPVDLLVCSDVMHYVATPELKRGLSGFSEHCDGVAFLELYTAEDDVIGDKQGFIARTAGKYRNLIAAAGFFACGPHAYLSENLRASAAALEVLR